jgi:hypothetical protein
MIAAMFEWYILVAWYLLWIILLTVLALDWIKTHLKVKEARRKGLYPLEDQEPSLEDVKRLVAAEEYALAGKLFSDMEDVGDKEARLAIEKIKAEFAAAPAGGVSIGQPTKTNPV